MTVSLGGKIGTVDTIPVRLKYPEDWERAVRLVQEKGIGIYYQTVASVPPFEATIHFQNEDGERARELITEAGIPWHPPKPFY